MRLKIIGVCAVLMAVAAGVPAGAEPAQLIRVQSDSADYRYCYVGKSPYGDPVYFSEAFRVDRGTYAVGIQNDFNSYVTGRYDSNVISGAVCMGPYDSMGEAASALNDHLGERRRAGKSVVTTYWRYRGD